MNIITITIEMITEIIKEIKIIEFVGTDICETVGIWYIVTKELHSMIDMDTIMDTLTGMDISLRGNFTDMTDTIPIETG